MTASQHEQGVGEMTAQTWITLSLRVLLGAWFLYNGGFKIFGSGLDVFAGDLHNYRLLPDDWVAPVAYLVAWTEVVASLLLMFGVWRRGSILVIFAMVIGFMVFIGWAWRQQLDISCGCRGDGEPISFWFKVIELPGYLLILLWLWWKGDKAPSLWTQKKQNMA